MHRDNTEEELVLDRVLRAKVGVTNLTKNHNKVTFVVRDLSVVKRRIQRSKNSGTGVIKHTTSMAPSSQLERQGVGIFSIIELCKYRSPKKVDDLAKNSRRIL